MSIPAASPHAHLDPRNIARIATALAERMGALDAAKAANCQTRTGSGTPAAARCVDCQQRHEKTYRT